MLTMSRRRVALGSCLVMLLVFAALLHLPGSHSGVSAGDRTAPVVASGGLRAWFVTSPESLEFDPVPLDEFIETQLARAHMPGLSAAIVKHGQIVWTGTYGYSRIDTQEPISEDTIFELASISKTFIATALGQLWEQGRLDLDADINEYLPFQVNNPSFPATPITARMLASHTSTILDVGPFYLKGCRLGDPTISLRQYMEDTLTPASEPGTAWSYSNTGASLAAYLVEVVSGIPFDAYCRENIFEPLGMTDTSLRFADLDLSHIARPYGYKDSTAEYFPYPFHTCPDYPAGWVMTSAPQLARHLIAFMRYGEIDGVRILQADTVEEIRRLQYPELESTFGLFWYYKRLMGRDLIGHNGGNWGVATEMFFQPETDTGVILLMNGDWSNRNFPMVMSIEDRLFREASNF